MTETIATVIENKLIAENTYILTFSTQQIFQNVAAGAFVMLKACGGDMPLKRPFGILSHKDNVFSVAYQVKGRGTEQFKGLKSGDELGCLLPLGNGFDLSGASRIALVGGGAGIFPLLSVFDMAADAKIFAYLGFRNEAAVCLTRQFSAADKLVITTDDGLGYDRGNAVESFLKNFEADKPDLILACGPKPMLTALKAAIIKHNITAKCQVSLEERMACGIGACLVCTCKKADGNNARVCKDGPVFDVMEVEL